MSSFLMKSDNPNEVLVIARGGSGRWCWVHEITPAEAEGCEILTHDEIVQRCHEIVKKEYKEGKLRKDWPLGYILDWVIQF